MPPLRAGPDEQHSVEAVKVDVTAAEGIRLRRLGCTNTEVPRVSTCTGVTGGNDELHRHSQKPDDGLPGFAGAGRSAPDHLAAGGRRRGCPRGQPPGRLVPPLLRLGRSGCPQSHHGRAGLRGSRSSAAAAPHTARCVLGLCCAAQAVAVLYSASLVVALPALRRPHDRAEQVQAERSRLLDAEHSRNNEYVALRRRLSQEVIEGRRSLAKAVTRFEEHERVHDSRWRQLLAMRYPGKAFRSAWKRNWSSKSRSTWAPERRRAGTARPPPSRAASRTCPSITAPLSYVVLRSRGRPVPWSRPPQPGKSASERFPALALRACVRFLLPLLAVVGALLLCQRFPDAPPRIESSQPVRFRSDKRGSEAMTGCRRCWALAVVCLGLGFVLGNSRGPTSAEPSPAARGDEKPKPPAPAPPPDDGKLRVPVLRRSPRRL